MSEKTNPLKLSNSTSPFDLRKFSFGDPRRGVIDAVMCMQANTFSDGGLEREILEKDFRNPKNTILVLYNEGGLPIGITYAEPAAQIFSDLQDEKTAYVSLTLIDGDYRGNGLVWTMLEGLDEELRKRGYTHVLRDASSHDGYAERLCQHYGSRVENPDVAEHESVYGRQKRLLIQL